MRGGRRARCSVRGDAPHALPLEWAYFDGRYWVPRAPVSEPGGEADFADGVMTLASPDEAVFVADSGPEVRFRPAAADYRPPPCA